jgi:hypothetical protein
MQAQDWFNTSNQNKRKIIYNYFINMSFGGSGTQYKDSLLDVNQGIKHFKDASCHPLSIPTLFSYLHKPFQQSHLNNTNA